MIRTTLKTLLLVTLLLCQHLVASAATLRVPADYTSVADALNAAADGDTVEIADGTYYVGMVFLNKDLTLQSASGNPAACILNGVTLFIDSDWWNNKITTNVIRGLTIADSMNPVVQGSLSLDQHLTVENCIFLRNSNSAIQTYDIGTNSTLQISNCVFKENGDQFTEFSAIRIDGTKTILTDCIFAHNGIEPVSEYPFTPYGTVGGWSSAPLTVNRCTFTDNSATMSGGIHVGSMNVTNSTFTNNTGTMGGAVFADQSDTCTFTNCVFTNNRAIESSFYGNPGGGVGGAIYKYYGNFSLVNCTFANNNAASKGGAVYINDFSTDIALSNCLFWGNSAPVEPQIQDNLLTFVPPILQNCLVQSYPGLTATPDANGNFSADPLFVRLPGTNNPDDPGDLRLQPASPAINAGSNALLPLDILDLDNDGNTTETLPFDLDGTTRVSGGTVDLGAYELLLAANLSTQVQVTRSGLRKNFATGRFVQNITLKNTGTTPLPAPPSLVLDNLSSNATLFNKTSVTVKGSPYRDTGSLAPGASITLALEFTNPTNAAITYTTRLLAGEGVRY